MIYTLYRVVHAVAAIVPTLQPVPPTTYTPPTETLIVIGQNGTVSIHSGLSHHLCAESINIVLYGMTLEQTREWQKEKSDAMAELSIESKPHTPVSLEEKRCYALLKPYPYVKAESAMWCSGLRNPTIDVEAGTIAEDTMELISPAGETYVISYAHGGVVSTGHEYNNTVNKILCISGG